MNEPPANFEYHGPLTVLGGITAGEFLTEYWQRKPLLVRNAFPDFQHPLDADELAGLACEEWVESRIITGSAKTSDWQLQHGPFSEEQFATLGDRDWTLLVQAVDHYLEGVAHLRQAFRFIPDWRLDDVMVSFAAPGGSVGPHLDQYDVFLIQGQGTRQWQIGKTYSGSPPLLEHPDLQLLREFNGRESHLLGNGDMLYLPPGVPHWGVAAEPCMTYSIGFRAPAEDEVISGFCDHILERIDGSQRYTDAGMEPANQPGHIGPDAVARIRKILAQLQNDNAIEEWLGRTMTAAKYPSEEDSQAVILADGMLLAMRLDGRLAYTGDDSSTMLYADGNAYSGTGKTWQVFVKDLCLERAVAIESNLLKDNSVRDALQALVGRGILVET